MFSRKFSPCSLGGTLCMFCEKICSISATLLTQKNNFLKNEDYCVCKVTAIDTKKCKFFLDTKKWNFFPELFPTLTQWHSVHHLRILPVQTRERFIASVHILPVKRMFVTSYYGMCHMSATHDTKKRSSRN